VKHDRLSSSVVKIGYLNKYFSFSRVLLSLINKNNKSFEITKSLSKKVDHNFVPNLFWFDHFLMKCPVYEKRNLQGARFLFPFVTLRTVMPEILWVATLSAHFILNGLLPLSPTINNIIRAIKKLKPTPGGDAQWTLLSIIWGN